MKKLLTMVALARKADVPRSTIKFWVEKGLIKPTKRGKSGYGYFDEETLVRRITEIKRLQKEQRRTLKEIKEILKK